MLRITAHSEGTRATLELEGRLAGDWVAELHRVWQEVVAEHRSIVVNVDRVTEIEPWFSGDCHVLLRGGVRLRLSRGHREALERRLR